MQRFTTKENREIFNLNSSQIRHLLYQRIRLKLIKEYNCYYDHWKDFTILLSWVAMVGMIIIYVQYEKVFRDVQSERSLTSYDVLQLGEQTVLCFTIVAIFIVFVKEFCA